MPPPPPPAPSDSTLWPPLTQAQACAVLRGLVAGAAQALQQEGPDVAAVVGVDQAQRVQRAALAASAEE